MAPAWQLFMGKIMDRLEYLGSGQESLNAMIRANQEKIIAVYVSSGLSRATATYLAMRHKGQDGSSKWNWRR
jgi:hypothetical protein